MSAVEDYLAEHADAALADLEAFCRIPSVSTDPAFRGTASDPNNGQSLSVVATTTADNMALDGNLNPFSFFGISGAMAGVGAASHTVRSLGGHRGGVPPLARRNRNESQDPAASRWWRETDRSGTMAARDRTGAAQ